MFGNISKIFRNLKISILSPAENALSLTLGFYLGIFPVFGTTTLLCLAVILIFRLNPALVLAMNWITTPLQLIFIYPFLKIGRILFFDDDNILPGVSIKMWLHSESWDAARHLFESVIGGVVVWGMVSIATGYFLYKLFLKISFAVSGSINSN
jgi:uncharacterized protein (DUF2062 family)